MADSVELDYRKTTADASNPDLAVEVSYRRPAVALQVDAAPVSDPVYEVAYRASYPNVSYRFPAVWNLEPLSESRLKAFSDAFSAVDAYGMEIQATYTDSLYSAEAVALDMGIPLADTQTSADAVTLEFHITATESASMTDAAVLDMTMLLSDDASMSDSYLVDMYKLADPDGMNYHALNERPIN